MKRIYIYWLSLGFIGLILSSCNTAQKENPLINLKKGLWIPASNKDSKSKNIRPSLILTNNLEEITEWKYIFFEHRLQYKDDEWHLAHKGPIHVNPSRDSLYWNFISDEGIPQEEYKYTHLLTETVGQLKPESIGNTSWENQSTEYTPFYSIDIGSISKQSEKRILTTASLINSTTKDSLDEHYGHPLRELISFEKKQKLLFLSIAPTKKTGETFVVKYINSAADSMVLFSITNLNKIPIVLTKIPQEQENE